jgi:sulfite reductase beta subunit-like hemoprotein
VPQTIDDGRRAVPPTSDDGCPGVLRLHAGADGLVARVRVPGGMLGARQLRALARAARIGSDIVELTSRAGIQIRGLDAADATGDDAAGDAAGELRDALAAGGLLPSTTHDRVRNILASPLAGRDPSSVGPTDQLVGELDRLICSDPRLAALPGRFVFEVDDGSRIGRPVAADVTLRVLAGRPHDRGHRFALALAGVATDLRVRSTAAAARLAVAAARAFLDLRAAAAAEPAWRIDDLPGAAAEIALRLGGALLPPGSPAGPTPPPELLRRPSAVGVTTQRDGLHAVSALVRLGRLDAAQLDGLADLAERCHTPDAVRLSPWKTVTLLDVSPDESPALAASLTRLGLDVLPGSPWVGLSACAGNGACARSRLDVRRLAAVRAAAGRLGETEHWSGCPRRCGQPAGAAITVAPTERALLVELGGVGHDVATPADALELLAVAAR